MRSLRSVSVDRDKTVTRDRALGCPNLKSMINKNPRLLKPTIKIKGQILSFIILTVDSSSV